MKTITLQIPQYTALCKHAGEQLFRVVKYNPIHPLRYLVLSECSIPYGTRSTVHNDELRSKTAVLNDECNCIYRVVCKDCFSVLQGSPS